MDKNALGGVSIEYWFIYDYNETLQQNRFTTLPFFIFIPYWLASVTSVFWQFPFGPFSRTFLVMFNAYTHRITGKGILLSGRDACTAHQARWTYFCACLQSLRRGNLRRRALNDYIHSAAMTSANICIASMGAHIMLWKVFTCHCNFESSTSLVAPPLTRSKHEKQTAILCNPNLPQNHLGTSLGWWLPRHRIRCHGQDGGGRDEADKGDLRCHHICLQPMWWHCRRWVLLLGDEEKRYDSIPITKRQYSRSSHPLFSRLVVSPHLTFSFVFSSHLTSPHPLFRYSGLKVNSHTYSRLLFGFARAQTIGASAYGTSGTTQCNAHKSSYVTIRHWLLSEIPLFIVPVIKEQECSWQSSLCVLPLQTEMQYSITFKDTSIGSTIDPLCFI